MQLKCPVCGSVPTQKSCSDFAIELYEKALDWPENGEEIPIDRYYARLGTVPKVGERLPYWRRYL